MLIALSPKFVGVVKILILMKERLNRIGLLDLRKIVSVHL